MSDQVLGPSPTELKQLLPTLDGQQLHRLRRVVLGFREPALPTEPLTLSQQLTAYLFEWLVHLNFVSSDQMRFLLEAAHADLVKSLTGGREHATCTLTLAERRYASWTGSNAWLDLADEQTVARLPEEPVTLITCNLVGLLSRKQGWLKKLRGV